MGPAEPSPSSCDDDEWEKVDIPTSPSSSPPPRGGLLPLPPKHDVNNNQPAITPPIMPGWKDEYLASLLDAERNNPVNLDLVEACSLLNDRIASLEAERASGQWSSHPPPPPPPQTPTPTTTKPDADPSPRLRTDLAEALRRATALDARLRRATADRDALQAGQRADARLVAALTAERDALRVRVRDQAEELRGKKQMLERVQDEVLALDLQLNVAEQQKARIAAENKQLIERWMARMGQEADRMNDANERGPGDEGQA